MNLISLLQPYILALILTLIIEGILCLLILRDKSWLRFTCLVNMFTNPLVNAIYTLLFWTLANHGLAVFIPVLLMLLELLVWLSEAWLFYRFALTRDDEQRKSVSSIYKALLFSFVLNAVSCGTGLLL